MNMLWLGLCPRARQGMPVYKIFQGVPKMRNPLMSSMVAVAVILLSPFLLAQTATQSRTAADQTFDPHDLSGDWMSYRPAGLPPLDREANFGASNDPDNKTPAPPLTPWGREHLLVKSISHGGMGNKPRTQDPNGVPANDPEGEYPGQNCEPIAAPAQFNFTGSYPVEFVMTPSSPWRNHVFLSCEICIGDSGD